MDSRNSSLLSLPFAEPPWLRGLPSSIFDDSHRRLQTSCKLFIDEHLNRHALEWETMEEVPSHVFAEFAQGNFVLPALPAPLPVTWLKQLESRECRETCLWKNGLRCIA